MTPTSSDISTLSSSLPLDDAPQHVSTYEPSEPERVAPTPPPAAPLTRAERVLTLFVPIFLMLTLYGLYVCVSHIEGWVQWVAFALALPASWALADFITGVTHWALDTYGSEETPYLGYVLIKPFRMHHEFPTYMVQFDDAPTIANSAAGATPLQLGAIYLASFGGWWSIGGMLIIIALFGAVATNLFHKWSHMDTPPPLARFLQRAHLILTVAHHEEHHAHPHDRSYCITNGWMNPILDRLHFWRGFERVLGLIGCKPQSEIYLSAHD